MILIENKIQRQLKNFWNHCHFHPTDAIEDPWGKRILDRFAQDGAIRTVRVYAMLEDVVYTDEKGTLCYDFRLTDLRLDYLVEQGFDILLSYNFMPECIARDKNATSTVCKNSTRYKGKVINTSVPVDYALWEEVCYEYTAHIVQRYGIDRVSKWHLQCWNEPDLWLFFMATEDKTRNDLRLKEYCKLYRAYERGLRRASEKLCIGGMGLASDLTFLDGFLKFVTANDLRLDYISLHTYGPSPTLMHRDGRKLSIDNHLRTHYGFMEVIEANGFGDREIVYDEWGAAAHGFVNRETAPEVMFRETEVYAAYYTRLIWEFVQRQLPVSKMLMCLSGQHEMTEDFTGFRNFFTLNFIAKPIYNAYILASRLKTGLLSVSGTPENVYVMPTKNEAGDYAVMLTYCSEHFEEDLPELTQTVSFAEDISGKQVRVYCIDKEHTNPYRRSQRTDASIRELQQEGTLQPVLQCVADDSSIELSLSANCTYLIEVNS